MYKYQGFGLNITSVIEMPELVTADFEQEDVSVSFGKVPDALNGDNVVIRGNTISNNDEYILEIKNTVRYYAGYGKTVIAEPSKGTDEKSIRLFLLGTVMAAILYQRGRIPLHASAIERNGKLTLFTGKSGAGKSTILATLATRGYTIFTDDICVVQHDVATNRLLGVASYPMLKLWEDSLIKIGSDSFNRDFKIRPHMLKYGHFFHDDFQTEGLPIEKVFILYTSNDAGAELTHNQLDTLQAFKQLERQAYRYRFATSTPSRPQHFSVMSKLAGSVPVIVTKRPHSGTTVTEFADLIETLL